MKVIGLTGGIGSGKSTVARAFDKLGVPIFIADQVSKKILATDAQVIQKVQKLLGEESYILDEQGNTKPDKKFIASLVFNNDNLLESLNSIMHPAVRNYFNTWLDAQNSPYIIYEAAILFESEGHSLCDQIILVTASINERIRRVMKRDHVSREEVVARIDKQWPDSQKLPMSDFVIINENIDEISSFTKSIHDLLLKS